jgi:hypothetical protein
LASLETRRTQRRKEEGRIVGREKKNKPISALRRIPFNDLKSEFMQHRLIKRLYYRDNFMSKKEDNKMGQE